MNTYEEFVSRGITLVELLSDTHWVLGDLILLATQQFAMTAKEFGLSIGLGKSASYEHAHLSEVFDVSARADYGRLQWTHFRIVARHCDDLKTMCHWLDYAAKDNWTTDQLQYELIKDSQSDDEPLTIEDEPLIDKTMMRDMAIRRLQRLEAGLYHVTVYRVSAVSEVEIEAVQS